jgi:hypothetical protein
MARTASRLPQALALAALSTTPFAATFGDETDVVRTCINRSSIRSTKVLDDRNVLFVMRDKTTYNNPLAKHCPGMHRGSPLSFTYADNKLCAGNNFAVLIRTGPSSNPMPYTDPLTNAHSVLQGPSFAQGAVCQLGLFTPITADEVADLTALTDKTRRGRRMARDPIQVERAELPPDSPSPTPPVQ